MPDIPEAEATTGDFSIFRNDLDNSSIDSSGAEYEVPWDTVVEESGNIDLLSGSTTIDLAEGGKYLVLYNVWAEESDSTNRRSFETYLTVNESELAYGRGDGYIRDSGNDDQFAYANGGAIIDVSAGDDLKVNIARDDTNSASSEIRAGTNGVSVLKLEDDLDYLRVRKDIRSTDISANNTFTEVTWDAIEEIDTGSFAYETVTNPGDITLSGTEGAYFLVTSNVRLNQDAASGNRSNYEMRLTVDGVEVPGTRSSAYLRGNPNTNGIYSGTLVHTGLVRKSTSSDEVLTLEVRRETPDNAGTPAVDIVGGETAISIAALPATTHFISLTSTSSQVLPSSQAALTFDQQIEVESEAFSHSESVDPSRINIDLDDDYLFFSNGYTSRTTGGDRDPVRIEWRVDGVTTYGYGGHGSFNRGDQGDYDAFTSGSSGGIIIPGLTSSQYIEVTAYDEEDAGTSDFLAGQVALQGIALSSLALTDVEVSATSTQAVSQTLPSTAQELGGSFIISENSSSRNVTSISIAESGTIDAQNGLDNIEISYDLDETLPYNCVSESFDGDETQFGATDTNGFSAADGSSSFSDSVNISTTRTLCVYVTYDITDAANDGETIEISIDNPITDVVVTGGGSIGPGDAVAPQGSIAVRNAELTQTHFRWLEDDGAEGVASAVESEDVAAIGFANGTTRRLRLQVDAAGSTSSLPTNFRLEYATQTSACSLASVWDNVGDSGGAWDMANSGFITDGGNTTNIAPGSGGLTDPAGATFLGVNGGLRDVTSQTGSLTLASTSFAEFEFAIEPTVSAPQGNTYCFRLSDGGTDLRNYGVYAEGTISADITVSASSSQAVTLDLGSSFSDLGGAFVIERPGTTRTLTDITFTESGTIDADADISDVALYYDLDTTVPLDCTGETRDGDELQFGATSTGGFNAPDGTVTFSDTASLSSTQTFCGYIVLDIDSGAVNGETIDVGISNPSTDVVVTSSSVGPSGSVSPTGSTTVAGPILTQTHYHWRNDNGDETDTGATSATGGTEDTALLDLARGVTTRLRVQVSNEGTVSSAASQFQLEYGTKITTCEDVSLWTNVEGANAFSTSSSAFIADGNTTDIDNTANGAMTEENTSFVGTGALRESVALSGSITLSSTEYTELEFLIASTDAVGFDTDYCFRVSASGNPLPVYSSYPEATTREDQDFFIQRGTETVTGTSTTLVAGVDYTAPAAIGNTFVRITNTHMTGAGGSAAAQDTPDDFTAYIEDPENLATSFTIARPATADDDTNVSWEIIEYTGLTGADNEMIVRDVGTITYGGSALFATGTIVSDVDDDSDVVVFITGQQNPDAGTSDFNNMLSVSAWNSTNTVPVFERGDADGVVAQLSYAVVEFTGANWKVQRIEHTYTAAGVFETEPIDVINSISRAFLHTQKLAGEEQFNLDDAGHEVFISSVGAISFELESGVQLPGEHRSVAWLIENTQTGDGAMQVYQTDDTFVTGGGDQATLDVGITATVNVSNASIWANNQSTGGGNFHPRSVLGVSIINSTQYQFYRADDGQNQDFRVEVVEWPLAKLSIRQSFYRLYADNDAVDPTDPWPAGAEDLGENTSITTLNEPPGEGDVVRMRVSLAISNATFPVSTESFKLQYGRQDGLSCSAIVLWNDVGDVNSGSIWRGFDATPVDGVSLSTDPPTVGALNLSVSDVAGTYEEANNSALNPYAVEIGEDVEYDWVVQHNGATDKTDYCFRMVYADGTILEGYENYPTVRTAGYAPVVSQWQWFDDEVNETPASSLAGENVAPSNIENGNVLKLRTTVGEIDGAQGNNIKFKLQFSEFADFSQGVRDVKASSTCLANDLWCYADGGGVDNATITTAVLSDADPCIAAAGLGCGTHNESTTTPATPFIHGARDTKEFEFTIQHAGARANAVYYFRLFDVGNDDVVLASTTYPSLTTESAQLTFALSGLDAGTVIDGETLDVESTTTTIPFGAIPLDTEYVAGYRLRVDTNATEGYKVLMFADQPLTNSYGTPIESIAGTNDSPISWDTGCAPNTASCFGYHVEDDILAGGSNRFAADDSFAAISTSTPEEVMFSSVPTEDVHDILYKIQIGNGQPAGDYEANLTFISVPIY